MFSAYTLIQWLAFFFLYCFIGWIFESTVVSVKNEKLINRGFLRGPFIPIYGFGALIMLLVSEPFQDNLFLTFLAGMIGATVLEYVVGVVMEAIFKVRYWDYSHCMFNIQGYICLKSSLCWGFFTILMTRYIHTALETVVLKMNTTVLTVLTILVLCIFVADVIASVKTALDLRKFLEAMEKAKTEFADLQKQWARYTENQVEKVQEEFKEFLEEKKVSLEEKKDSLKEKKASLEEKWASIEEKKVSIEEKKDLLSDKWKDVKEGWEKKIQNWLAQFEKDKNSLFGKAGFTKASLMKRNPTARSRAFSEAYEQLKEHLLKNKKEKDE